MYNRAIFLIPLHLLFLGGGITFGFKVPSTGLIDTLLRKGLNMTLYLESSLSLALFFVPI